MLQRRTRQKGILLFFTLILVITLNGIIHATKEKYSEPKVQNPLILQAFYWEMGTGEFAAKYPEEKDLWRLLAKRAPEFADLGFTSLWLPPASKGTSISDVGYGVYDPWDLGEFNQKGTVRTKYGTKKELQKAIDTLHQYGISVYYDAVFNQRIGADFKEEVPLVGGGTMEAWTLFSGMKGRNKYYDKAKEWGWNWQCFDGIDVDATGRVIGPTLFHGKNWDRSFDKDYLLGCDVDYQNEKVVEEIIAWGKWLVQEIGVDGFRLDAVKHVDTEFVKKWLKEIRACTEKELFIMGEAWYTNTMSLQFYLEALKDQEIKLFDFPLRSQMELMRDGRINMANLGNAGLVNKKPTQAVTFVDNHDTFRDGLNSAPIFKRKCQSYAYILTREHGYPVVFWRDLYNANLHSELEKIIKARKYFAYGPGYEVVTNDQEVYSYVRAGLEDADGTGLVMMISSGNSGQIIEKKINAQQPGQIYYDFTGNISELVETDSQGYGIFKVKNTADRGWSIWVPKKD